MKKFFEFIVKNIKSNFFLYLILTVTFILRLKFLSPYLEDWDSVQFALGLHNYSIVDHQPHPPGYPLYTLLGKFFYLFLQDDLKALTFLSSFLGSLILIPLYYFTKKMFDKTTAHTTILLFALTPLPWLLSEVALTDIPGLFFLVSAAFLIYLTRNNDHKFLFVCLLSGLILGFRTNSFLILLSLIFLIILGKRNMKLGVLSTVVFIMGIAIWFIPLIIITGPKQFLESYSSISTYVIFHDVLLGNNLGLKNIVKIKVDLFWYLLQISYTHLFSIFSAIILGYLFIKKKLLSDLRYQFLSVWIISHLIPQFTFYNLEMPRHTLAILPPVLILVSSVIAQLIRKNFIFTIPLFLLLNILFSQSWSQVSRFKQKIPPTIQPIEYVKNNFKPEEVIIIASLTYRHFQYYAPEYKTYFSDKISRIDIPKGKTVIIDYPKLKDKLASPEIYNIVESYEFGGDKDIFPRVSKTNLYILK